jgi:hypothetical protein
MAHVAKALAMTTAALVLAGCAAASGSGSPPGGSPTGPSGTPAPTTSGAGAGLRGVQVPALSCEVGGLEPAGTVRRLPAKPVSVVVCPGAVVKRLDAVTLDPVPENLLSALAQPDPPPPAAAGVVCAMYADVIRPVYARLADGAVYRLWVPQDQACHHYVPSVVRLLDSYLPVGPLPPKANSSGAPG